CARYYDYDGAMDYW
nr:immunoglobulin heavy chain junction region [Mus musculus]